jgi:hypothetical protein
MGFIDDQEKMVDFFKLTKEEFLLSYSYLSEKEYDETKREVEKRNVKIDLFTYSEWFKNKIYVSPNDNIYCLYPFDNGIKLLIMDEDMKFDTYEKIVDGVEEPNEISEVMVYWMYTEMDSEEEVHNTVRKIVTEYETDSEKFFKKYNTKNRNQIGGITMAEYKVKLNMSEEYTIEAQNQTEAEEIARDKFGNDYLVDDVEVKEIIKEKEIKTVPPAEFFTKWKEMEDYWVKNDGDMDENSYYNRIINQKINIELPLLGIKTELFWCPPTVEYLDDMFKSMVEETYFDLLVEKEQCYYTAGGVWLAEVPFEYGEKQLVMVVDNEHTDIWAVYQNVLKDNGKWESVEYDELLVESNNANNILPDFQIYYIKALQLLAERKE